MRGIRAMVMAAMACAACANSAAAAVTFDWALVGDPGNANDSTGFGSVSYGYQISKREVTNSQYAEFLNAKATNDPLELYSVNMASDIMGGINRSGSSGSYTYSVKSGYANIPVVFVGWYDCIRFANWLHNGQGGGDTESGGYTLIGGTPSPINGDSVTRNAGARVFLPSENEWYKAAYYKGGGINSGYWQYATRSNAVPISDQPPGAFAPENSANYVNEDGLSNGYNDGYAVTGSSSLNTNQNYLTQVGAYSGSFSAYGTFDQNGNVGEWNEALSDGGPSGPVRGVRGGDWTAGYFALRASIRGAHHPYTEGAENISFGFRMAAIPEPSALVMSLSAVLLGVRRRRR